MGSRKLMGVAASILAAGLPSILKISLYRLLGMKIGRNVSVGFGTVIFCRNVDIQDGGRIGAFCLIRAEDLRLGKRAAIANFVRVNVHSLDMRSQSQIGSQNEISGTRSDPRSTMSLGPASWILPHCFVNVARPIALGRNVGIGGGSYLFTHGMWLSKLDGYPVSYGPISIGNDVWLPWGCFVMPNVTIGEGVIVGACSVVNRSLGSGVLAAGVPAKVIREKSRLELSQDERVQILVEVTESLGTQENKSRIDRGLTCDRHYIGEECVIVVHKTPNSRLEPRPTLNIVFSDLDETIALTSVTWSLRDYRSSPYSMLSTAIRDWFHCAREIGVRFYPIDEDFE